MDKSICFVINTLFGGGSERVVSILASKFCEERKVSIIVLSGKNQQDYDLPKTVEIISIVSSGSKLTKYFLLTSKLKNAMKKSGSSIFISFGTIENIFTILAGYRRKCKIIISERSAPIESEKSRIMLFLKKRLYSKADKIVFQTVGAQNEYSKKIAELGVVIENPIEDALPVTNSSLSGKNVCAVGRLVQGKNYNFMIRVWKKIVEMDEEYKLHIYGQGEELEILQRKVNMLNLRDNVFFEGFRKDIYKELIRFDMYIMTSAYEGMPNSLMEAMGMGIPCISSNCPSGGPATLIENQVNGLLYEVENENDFLKCFWLLANNYEMKQKFSTNARSIRNKYSVNNIVEKWRVLINSFT